MPKAYRIVNVDKNTRANYRTVANHLGFKERDVSACLKKLLEIVAQQGLLKEKIHTLNSPIDLPMSIIDDLGRHKLLEGIDTKIPRILEITKVAYDLFSEGEAFTVHIIRKKTGCHFDLAKLAVEAVKQYGLRDV